MKSRKNLMAEEMKRGRREGKINDKGDGGRMKNRKN